MHITLEADYAVRIVIYLAQVSKRADANTIANGTGVSLRFALKILRNLVATGIAKSFKGTQGGYELNKPSSEITLKEVLEAVEGEYVFSRCLRTDACCTKPKRASCAVQKVFGEITAKVQNMLVKVTIDQLIE